MRRRLRPDLPWLSAIYHLKWNDILDLPHGELDAYLRELPDIKRRLGQVELVEYR